MDLYLVFMNNCKKTLTHWASIIIYAGNNGEEGRNFVVIILDIYKAVNGATWVGFAAHSNGNCPEAFAREQSTGPEFQIGFRCQKWKVLFERREEII